MKRHKRPSLKLSLTKYIQLNDEGYDVHFNDVYGDIDQQYNAVKLFKKVIRRRKEYMEMTLMCQFTGTAVVFIHLFIYCMDLNKYN